MTNENFIELALSFPDTIATPHFDRTAFKAKNKRIFATIHEVSKTANLKFSPSDQSVFGLINKEAIHPVKNKWGLQGWTAFELEKIEAQIMLDALSTAYNESLSSKKT